MAIIDVSYIAQEYISKHKIVQEISPDEEVTHIFNGKPMRLPQPVKAGTLSCPLCNGSKGFRIVDSIEKWVAWSCTSDDCIQFNAGKGRTHSYQTQKVREINLCAYGVMIEHAKAKLDKCNQKIEVIKFLKEYAFNPKGFVILAGSNGTGKTFAACATIAAYLEKKENCRFVRSGDLYLEWLKIREDGGNDLGFIQKFVEYEFLVIDDLGIRTPSEAFLGILYLIIDKRGGNSLGTIITTNLSSDTLRDKYGDAITSRIVSGSNFKFEGGDRRMKLPF